MIKKIYFSILFFFFVLTVTAQWTNNSLQNTLVRDSSGTSEVTPLSATTSTGSTYISWFESFNGNYQLRMQLLDAAGNKLWNQEGLIVSDYPQASSLSRYDLKVDHNDNAVVAFQDIRTGGNVNVVAYMIDLSGNFVWGSAGISLIDPVSASGQAPVIGVTASNNIIIAWNAGGGSLQWVASKKISAAGNLLWGSTTKRIIDSTNAKKFTRPSIVPAGSDDFLMLYVQQTGSFPYTNTMFVQRYDINGDGAWPGSIQFSTKTTSFFFFPEAVSDLTDGMYMSFNTSNPLILGLNDVYVQHVDGMGNLWSASGSEAAVTTTNHSTTASLKFLFTRHEVWVLLKAQDSGQGMSGVTVQKFDTTGTALFAAAGVNVMPISNAYYEPYDFESTGNGMIIAFAENSGTTAKLLKAIKINYSGISAWGSGVVTVSSVVSPKLRLSEGTFHAGQVVVVWDDQRIDDGIYAQNIFDDGTIGPLAVPDLLAVNESFNLFPNPSDRLPVLKFITEQPGEITLNISDALGKIIYSNNILLNSPSNEIDLTKLVDVRLHAGIYFIELAGRQGKEVKKLVIE